MPAPAKKINRSLTVGEVQMLRQIFGSSINYNAVTVRNYKWTDLQPADVAMTPNGNIYFGEMLFKEDYAAPDIFPRYDKVHHFIHEMVHVWQYQLGYAVIIQGIGSVFGYGYKYKLDTKKKLSDYPMESQANIIADWAMYVLYGQAKLYSGKELYSLADLETVLADFIVDPKNKKNLPTAKNALCEAEPTSIGCM
ncbi:MAG: hypothetical protein LBF61_08265 [Azoarcus sp.]|jgi:hypothetical protein|nr:hypothetical protein [Azoarcus sp.]